MIDTIIEKFKSTKLVHKIFAVTIIVVLFSITFAGYFFYSKTSEFMMNASILQMTETIKQTSKYINEKLSFTLGQFDSLQTDPEFKNIYNHNSADKDYISDFVSLTSKFERLRAQNSKMIENIFFYRYDGRTFYEYKNILDKEDDYSSKSWYIAAKKGAMNLVWEKTKTSDTLIDSKDTKVFSMIKEVSDDDFIPRGILFFDIKEKFLEDELKGINLGEGSGLYIVDKDKNIISNSNETFNPQFVDNFIQTSFSDNSEKGNYELDNGSEKMLIVYDTIDVNGWKIIAAVPVSAITKKSNVVKSIVIYVAIISFMMFGTLEWFVIRYVTSPIKKLVGLMEQAENGHLDVRFNPKTDDEIGTLGKTFNNMIENIGTLMGQVQEERQMKVVAELRSLQQQMNSHFLYNTLDSIYWMAKSGMGNEAAEMAASLANILRLGLNKGSDITSVFNEIEHIKNYMNIQKFRYDEKLDYSIEVDSNILEYTIPKLILQPLIENSILHGIDKMDKKGIIQISGRKQDDKIIFEVADNGIGMNVAEVWEQIKLNGEQKSYNKKGGYALYNVYNRIKMRYGDEGTIEFYSIPDEGLRVVISLPLVDNQTNSVSL